MSSGRFLRDRRSLRSNDIYSELPNDYNEVLIDQGGVNDNNLDALVGSDGTVYDDVSSTVSTDTEGSRQVANDGDTIPEVNVQDIIDLANQIVRSSSSSDDDATIRFRFPSTPNAMQTELAREIIIQHEIQTNGDDNDGSDGSNNSRYYVHRVRDPHDSHSVTVRFARTGEPISEGQFAAAGPGFGRANLNGRPFWMELADFVTVTMFLVVIFRLIRNALSVTSFSTDILQDTFEFIDFVRDNETESAANSATKSRNGTNPNNSTSAAASSSLIMKFGNVVEKEFPGLGNSWKVILTIATFYPYTIVSSGLLIASFIFSIFCLALSIGKRWHSIQEFFVSIVKNGEDCV
ncbi:DEKNAAC100063 [Brettanomyces naardenensis]|uniref:DEKNAAC100063 n=1 Tax=Brettanomyces naardenensis TaxID=13370 RepID=A0A448YGD6_BRENA|nr:DEKNAAC100063 [Brettanomyces naardenensis]